MTDTSIFWGRCLAWDVSPVAPTPFGFYLFLFFFLFLVLYFKFILNIIRGVPNKAVEKKIFETQAKASPVFGSLLLGR